MSTLIKKGNLAARLSMEESGVKLADASATATLVYRGGLAELKTKAGDFTVGQTSSAVPANLNISGDTFKVTGIEMTGGAGGTGRLTVGLAAVSNSSLTVLPTEKGVDWQVEWTLVEKSIEQHSDFAALFTDSSTFAKIETWKKLSDYGYISEKAQFTVPNDLDNPTIWTPLTGDALKFCQKLAKGIAAYQVQVPVVRKTETTVNGPGLNASSKCGRRQSPPKFADLADAWLKTADSWSKSGQSKWEHRQEWTGFDSLDPDLYPASS